MDGAMFDDKCTVLPIWVRETLFNITERFPHRSKKHPDSVASIVIAHKGGKKTTHEAHITTLPLPKLGPVMRLHFGNDVKDWLSKAFHKTYVRNEQRKAHGLNGPAIERLIPFWEFIDIEWDAGNETFHFRAWYTLDHDDHIAKKLDRDIEVDLPKDLIIPKPVNQSPVYSGTTMELPKDHNTSFETECGHSVSVKEVKKVGGPKENKLYAKISGPLITGKSGKKHFISLKMKMQKW